MIWLNKVLYLIQSFKVLKNAVFEDSMEFVFETGENGSLLETVHADFFKVSIPVNSVQVEQFETMKD